MNQRERHYWVFVTGEGWDVPSVNFSGDAIGILQNTQKWLILHQYCNAILYSVQCLETGIRYCGGTVEVRTTTWATSNFTLSDVLRRQVLSLWEVLCCKTFAASLFLITVLLKAHNSRHISWPLIQLYRCFIMNDTAINGCNCLHFVDLRRAMLSSDCWPPRNLAVRAFWSQQWKDWSMGTVTLKSCTGQVNTEKNSNA